MSVSHSLSHSVSEWVSQSVNHSFIHSFNQSVNQSINQSVNKSISQSNSHSVSQSFSKSVSQSINQPISKSMNQLTCRRLSSFRLSPSVPAVRWLSCLLPFHLLPCLSSPCRSPSAALPPNSTQSSDELPWRHSTLTVARGLGVPTDKKQTDRRRQ